MTYICDSITVGLMFSYRLTFNPRSKATNIGYLLSLGAVHWPLTQIQNLYLKGFEDVSEVCVCQGDVILRIDTQTIVTILQKFSINNKTDFKQ